MKHFPITLTLALILAAELCAASKVLPVLNSPIADISTTANDAGTMTDLNTVFGTEEIDDEVVRFISQPSNGSRVMDFALFTNRTPITRTNFRKYVADGDYNQSFIHRSIPGFVIQGGGFYNTTPGSGPQVDSIPTNPTITNEFGISNTFGTVSMAKKGDDPDSATSQWFVSIGANSDNLDHQNGGFTVFGRVTKSTINSASDFGNTTLFKPWDLTQGNPYSPYSAVPLVASFVGGDVLAEHLALFPTVTLTTITPGDAGESTTLAYSILSNSNPAGVTASVLNHNELHISYPSQAQGGSKITIRTTDSVGNAVDDTFNIFQGYTPWRHIHFSSEDAINDSISGPNQDSNNDGLSNLRCFIHGLSTNITHPDPVIFSNASSGNYQYPSFTFPIIHQITGIGTQLQTSSDLGGSNAWTTIPHVETSRTTSGSIDTITIRSQSPTSDAKAFYRILFTLSE